MEQLVSLVEYCIVEYSSIGILCSRLCIMSTAREREREREREGGGAQRENGLLKGWGVKGGRVIRSKLAT